MFGVLRDESGKSLIVLRYTIQMFLGPNFVPSKPVWEQEDFGLHLAYFGALILDGIVLLAGPYYALDGAFVVLNEEKVKTYDHAVRIMKDDPWAKNRVSVAVVRLWDSNPLVLSGIVHADAPTREELEELRARALGA